MVPQCEFNLYFNDYYVNYYESNKEIDTFQYLVTVIIARMKETSIITYIYH